MRVLRKVDKISYLNIFKTILGSAVRSFFGSPSFIQNNHFRSPHASVKPLLLDGRTEYKNRFRLYIFNIIIIIIIRSNI